MKKKYWFYAIAIISVLGVHESLSQNITNTLGAGGVFYIKDGTTNFFTLTQSTGQVNILKTLRLENTSGSSVGVIQFGVDRFIHNYGAANTFVGFNSGNFTMSGNSNSAFGYNALLSNDIGNWNSAFGYGSLQTNTNGSLNSAFGDYSLYSNSSGNNNSAFGTSSLSSNTSGYDNSAFGKNSLFSNTTGYYNSAFGLGSLYSNTEGIYNSAFGFNSLYSNTLGQVNSAFGYYSLYSNTEGIYNSAFGNSSLSSNTLGDNNSAFGISSLYANTLGDYNSAFGNSSLLSTTGSNNTAIGFFSGADITTGSNNTTIGNDAQVPTSTSSNQVRIGNASVTYAGIQVAWTVTSDRKWKENIQSSPLGLNFISHLNPVSYTRKNDEKKRTEFGLIAQDVEEILKEYNINNCGMITVDDKGNYELRYNDLLAPMIKAIQQLEKENEELKAKSEKLFISNEELKLQTWQQFGIMNNRIKVYEETLNTLVKEIAKLKSENNNTLITLEKK